MNVIKEYKNTVLIVICLLVIAITALIPLQKKSVPTIASSTSIIAANNEDRLRFLSSNSISCQNEPCEIVDVIIPTEFNSIYQKYEALQKACGFSLENYKGECVKKYSYKILNRKNAVAELLVFENKIIGASVLDLAQGGRIDKILS